MKSSLRGMKARQPPSSTTAFHRHSFGHIGASRRQRQFEARRPLVLPDPTLGRCGSESQHECPQVIMVAEKRDRTCARERERRDSNPRFTPTIGVRTRPQEPDRP
jgi:hypothetical protein